MKTITTILTFGFLIITACIIYIIKSGVSIRTAPIIKPSIISQNFENVPQGLFLRLFPDIQQAHYIIWGVSQNSNEVQKTLAIMKERYEHELKTPVQFIYNSINLSKEDIEKCKKPCWIYLPEDAANELKPNIWIQQNIRSLGREYFTLTWIPFNRNPEIPDYCLKEKRLDLECLKVISIKEVKQKMPENQKRYFFVRKYMDRDYFLFIENPPFQQQAN